ncbi:sensor histidine kinase [Variovorax boronicumulans]|uniref:sensor histidine kinase n=1 Tax=Variovorax boronicumulans TaxID=436515 RepID=UPI0033956C07
MLSSAVQLPHHLEDQFVWLSIAAWLALLIWLRRRASRRRMLLWAALACGLHLTPVTAQMLRATSALTGSADGAAAAFWLLQAVNIAVLCMIVVLWDLSRRRAGRYKQLQAVLAERRRIASDLHDGVGSRLTALLASRDPRSGDANELSMALQDCLLELQMTVDALDDEASATVVERLGHLRYRIQPAFDRIGIALVWKVRDAAHARAVPPEAAMQVCRIAQEALSNVLRHSHASRVEVRFGPRDCARGLALEVEDDGQGLSPGHCPGLGLPMDLPAGRSSSGPLGKGLRSMRARAEALHGELAITNTAPHGLCIRLVMPCGELPQEVPAHEAMSTR